MTLGRSAVDCPAAQRRGSPTDRTPSPTAGAMGETLPLPPSQNGLWILPGQGSCRPTVRATFADVGDR